MGVTRTRADGCRDGYVGRRCHVTRCIAFAVLVQVEANAHDRIVGSISRDCAGATKRGCAEQWQAAIRVAGGGHAGGAVRLIANPSKAVALEGAGGDVTGGDAQCAGSGGRRLAIAARRGRGAASGGVGFAAGIAGNCAAGTASNCATGIAGHCAARVAVARTTCAARRAASAVAWRTSGAAAVTTCIKHERTEH